MKYKRIKNPIVPKSRTNPTGTSRILSAADKDISARYKRITEKVLAWFDSVPWLAFNAEGAYQFPASRMEELRQTVGDIFYQQLLAGGPREYFFADYVSDSAHLGLAQASVNLAAMSPVYATVRPLSVAMQSQGYVNRLEMALQKSYGDWDGIVGVQKSRITAIIADGIAQGINPKDVKKMLIDRLGMDERAAWSAAQTHITDTLRQAKMAEGEDTQALLGIEIKYLWTSTLQWFTRPWHASRNGKVYSKAEVDKFYSERGNRRNCYCAITEVLIEDGQPQLTQKLKNSMDAERVAWQKQYGDKKTGDG